MRVTKGSTPISSVYDVDAAKAILGEVPHEVQTGPVDRLFEKYLQTPEDAEENGIDFIMADYVDWERVRSDEEIDTSVPVIIAPSKPFEVDGEEKRAYNLIDGHHRLARAFDTKLEEIGVVVLTEEESDDIRDSLLPEAAE